MARSTSAQDSAAIRSSTSTSTDAEAGSCQRNAASAILHRHRAARQRFDSADFVLGDRLQKALAKKSIEAQASRFVPAGCATASDIEIEPEPEHCHLGAKQCHAFPRQRVRRLRLQRFDSADWALELQEAHKPSTAASSSDTKHGSVAHLLLERHAFKTCTGLTGPANANTEARYATQA